MTVTYRRNNLWFEWDEAKNKSNDQKHGYSFEDAAKIFDGPTLDRLDDRFDYGEERYLSVGVANGITLLTVCHTDRFGTIRLISARRATKIERKAYDKQVR